MASNMPVRLLTIPLPMSGPQQAERLFPPTAMPSSPASTSETMSRMAIIVWLGAQGFHNRDDQVRRILAEVQNIICLDGRFEIVVEGGVVEFFPGPIDLVEHRIFHIISLLLQLFDLPGEFDCLGPVGPCNRQQFSECSELVRPISIRWIISLRFVVSNSFAS